MPRVNSLTPDGLPGPDSSAGLTFTPLDGRDLDGALAVMGSGLGDEYVSAEELESYAGDADKTALVAKDGQVVAGAATARIFNGADDFLDSLPQDMAEPLRACLPGLESNRVGLIKSVAVHRSMQGRGIATRLVRESTERLWSLGATVIVSIGWTDDEGCHIQGVFESQRFMACADIPDFWLHDSTDKGYSCPTCGSPCRCTARIFTKQRTDLPAGTAAGAANRTGLPHLPAYAANGT